LKFEMLKYGRDREARRWTNAVESVVESKEKKIGL
jgi:hypothetical protein